MRKTTVQVVGQRLYAPLHRAHPLRVRQLDWLATGSGSKRELSSRTVSANASLLAPRSAPGKLVLSVSQHSCYPPTISKRHQSRSAVSEVPNFAFAFDIDGVLLRSSKPIEGATRGLQYLEKHKIPYILLTNGGGKHESVRVAQLREALNVDLTEKNFVQSHTPFKALVEGTDEHDALKDKTILVTGGDGERCRKVAEQYGFKNVVIPADILMACPEVWPFNQVFTDYHRSSARPLPTPIDLENLAESLKIDAVFVFNDPRDWALDSQIILDLLLSKDGVLGTLSPKNGDTSLPNNGWQQDGQPKLFFSNPDLFWASSYHLPRLGQGGYQAALQGVWNTTTGGAELTKTIIGKPHSHTYKFAEQVLNDHRIELLGGNVRSKADLNKLERVFMIGDNPESDIRGANDFQSPLGTDWTSILVKTGVFRAGSVPSYRPDVIVDDVLAGIKWGLKQQGWRGEI